MGVFGDDYLVDAKTGERLRLTVTQSSFTRIDGEGRVFRSRDGGPEEEIAGSDEGYRFLGCFGNWLLDVIEYPRTDAAQAAIDRAREEVITEAFCNCAEPSA